MNERQTALAEFETLNNEQNTLIAKGGNATSEDFKRVTEIDGQLDALETKLNGFKAIDAAAAKAKARGEFLNADGGFLRQPETDSGSKSMWEGEHSFKHVKVPARAKGNKPKYFKSDEDGSAVQKAFAFGQWAKATFFNSDEAKKWCGDNGFEIKVLREKVQTEGTNTAGGFLVPEQFEAIMIDLREKYGRIRQLASIVTMRSDTRTVPRRTGGLTAYAIGEGATITESNKSWDRVGLTAKKWAVIAKYSSELDEDSVIDIADDLAGEIAYAFSKSDDDMAFNGDGTSTYNGVVGIRTKLKAVDGTIGNIAGLVVGATAGAGSAYTYTLPEFEQVVGTLPEFAESDNTCWLCSKKVYWTVMVKLMLAAGGVTAREVAEGRLKDPMFMGYKVVIAQKMPNSPATSQIDVLFGEFSMGTKFGDRRQTTIALSEHVNFTEDEIAIRGTQRVDFNCHDVGDTVNPGPIVGLISHAS